MSLIRVKSVCFIGHHHIWRQVSNWKKVLLYISVEFRNMPGTGSGEASDTQPSLPTTSTVEPKSLEVHGLPCFVPKGEPTTLSVQWKRWKRAFHLYVTSKGVTNQAQKVALLLHSGEMELQEIYYTLAPEEQLRQLFNCPRQLFYAKSERTF